MNFINGFVGFWNSEGLGEFVALMCLVLALGVPLWMLLNRWIRRHAEKFDNVPTGRGPFMTRAIVLTLVLASSAGAEEIACFGKDRGLSLTKCRITRMNVSDSSPWWKCCGGPWPFNREQCRPAFEMYPTTKHCAFACNASKREIRRAFRCYDEYLKKKYGRRVSVAMPIILQVDVER